MKIAVNTLAARSDKHGVGVYITGTLNKLTDSYPNDKFLIFASSQFKEFIEPRDNVTFLEINLTPPVRILWEQFALPLILLQHRVDVFWGPVFVVPILKLRKTVVSILDLTFFNLGQTHTFAKRNYFRLMITLAVKVSDVVLSISENTTKDLKELFPNHSSKIITTPLAADRIFQQIKDEKTLLAIKKKFSLPEHYFIFIGVPEPRKNIPSLIEAFAQARPQIPEHLVLVGGSEYGWGKLDIDALIKERGLSKKVHRLGFVEKEYLPGLLTLSTALTYIPLYEGFGIPVVEAMSCGTPVVSSKISSLAEVGKGAALLVDPYNIGDISNALIKISQDSVYREGLGQKGLVRSKKYTWEETAKLTYNSFKEAVSNE